MKISVVFWSQSGNTAAMADAVGQGITEAGKEAEVIEVSSASLDALKGKRKHLHLAARQWERKCWKSQKWNRL